MSLTLTQAWSATVPTKSTVGKVKDKARSLGYQMDMIMGEGFTAKSYRVRGDGSEVYFQTLRQCEDTLNMIMLSRVKEAG